MKILENLENLNVSEECYNSIIFLIEEYINEFKDGVYRRTKDIANAIKQAQEEILPKVRNSKDREYVEKDIKKRTRQATKAYSKYENQVVARAKKEEEEKKAKKKEN